MRSLNVQFLYFNYVPVTNFIPFYEIIGRYGSRGFYFPSIDGPNSGLGV